ncbi:MAG: BamA/TamA family outer membrane protein [Candidatus Omnitrophica bacterium]|nr:BamA/TamA family outer membrane protein [Candidatus Omnitrophota bacterium]
MNAKIKIGWIIFTIFSLAIVYPSFSAPTPEQEAGGQERTRELQEKEKALREKIEQAPQAPQVVQEPQQEPQRFQSNEKTLINQINVTGVTFISEKEVNDIISQYQNKEITMNDLQKAADMITDIYRKKGYITSRAYLPPQKIENNTVEIRIIEGTMGDVDVKGNRYFKTDLFKKKIGLKKGEPFNYNILRGNLSKINQYPDRKAKAILAPGKEAGQTDVSLEVKDNLPIHISFDWDNYGSKYIDKQRYQAVLTHNNFLGFDDILTLQYQFGQKHDLQEQHDYYRLASVRYLFPLNDRTDIGFYAARSKLTLGKEFETLKARGKSEIYSLYSNYTMIKDENLTLTMNTGFDYKNIINFQLGDITSMDKLRIFKLGFEWDRSDNYGRTIINNEMAFGIPNLSGGLEKHYDTIASRVGSGGNFTKDTIDFIRLNRMPFSSTLLLKDQTQISPNIMTATEQFQIGGISNLRGYPVAEAVGDTGSAITGELSMPPYMIPKNLNVPLSKTKLYDALKIAVFYDWGNVKLRDPQAGEHKRKTLRSAGWGMRLNLPEDFSARLDFGYPLDQTPSDGHHLHTWVKISKGF